MPARCWQHAKLMPDLHPVPIFFADWMTGSTHWTAGFRSSLAVLALAAICPAGASELHWDNGPGYRSAALLVPKEGRNGFSRVSGSVSGILFTNVLSQESGARTQLRLAGSGVAAADVDADGWCDLYFCGMEGGNRLYRNLGAWRFEDITD